MITLTRITDSSTLSVMQIRASVLNSRRQRGSGNSTIEQPVAQNAAVSHSTMIKTEPMTANLIVLLQDRAEEQRGMLLDINA